MRSFGVSLELWHASTNRCLCYNATPAATLTLPQSRLILHVVYQSSFVSFSVGFFRVGVSLRLSLRPILQHHANDSAAHWQPSSCGPAATPLPLSPPVHLILLPLSSLSSPFPIVVWCCTDHMLWLRLEARVAVASAQSPGTAPVSSSPHCSSTSSFPLHNATLRVTQVFSCTHLPFLQPQPMHGTHTPFFSPQPSPTLPDGCCLEYQGETTG